MNTFSTFLKVVCFTLFLFLYFPSQAQDGTYDRVYTIIQDKCATCHSGANPAGNLNFDQSKLDLYNTLIDGIPDNTVAQSKNNKLVDPGYPERSFLLRKLARSDFDTYYQLENSEGAIMPPYGSPPVADKDIELVRQWIMFGAPELDTVVDPQILTDFYENNLGLPFPDRPAAPAAGEGFQIRLGPFFLNPLEEREFFKKHALNLPQNLDVKKLEAHLNAESHHLILYDLTTSATNNYSEGLRDIDEGEFSMVNNSLVAAWQFDGSYELPATTSYKWLTSTNLDLNYHLFNYNATGILPCDVYINIYTEPYNTSPIKMWSMLFPIDASSALITGNFGQSLIIPNNGEETTFTESLIIPNLPFLPFPTGDWHIWMLSTHTHSRGVDYDIYKRNPDGTKGMQLYEGFFNSAYTANQGFYDWSHPTIRFFDDPVLVNMEDGLIHEATYINNTPDTLRWGNTTLDEMMLIFIQFTDTPFSSTGVLNPEELKVPFIAYPNPADENLSVRYQLDQGGQVQLVLYNLMGQKMKTIVDERQGVGNYFYPLDLVKQGLSSGTYFLRLTLDGKQTTRKIVLP